MTTRNLVPRGDSEGKLGISSKRWEEVNAVTLKVTNLQTTSGSILLKKGPGIEDIALDSGQLKIALDDTFLTSLGFNADGTQPSFAKPNGDALPANTVIAANDSIIDAIQKLNDDLREVSSPTTLGVNNFADASIVKDGEAVTITEDTSLMTTAAIHDHILAKIDSETTLTVDGDSTTIDVNLFADDLQILGGTGITSAVTRAGASTDVKVTLDLDNTLTAEQDGTFGSSTAIPSFTVNQQGRITAASSNNLSDISVTSFSDISNAGSGEIITSNERTKLSDATEANSASKLVIRDGSGDFAAGTITAALSGNATSATSAGKWTNAATLTLGGDLSGSVDIDGSAGVTLTATIKANSVALGTDTTGNYVSTITIAADSGLTSTGASSGEGIAHSISVDGVLAQLHDLGQLADGDDDGKFIVATAENTFAYESGSTVRTSLGLGSSDSPSFAGLTSTDNLLIDNQKELRFGEVDGNGTEYVAIKSPAALGSSYTLTLPTDDGTENFVLITDGSGVLSWSAVTGASGATNSFSTVSVDGQDDLEADTSSDTLTFASGSGISLSTTAGTDTLTITASGIATGQLAANAGIVDTQLATISTANKVSLTALDINGAGDIGAALADEDLIIIDDGAGGTNKKTALSRVASYINNHSSITTLSSLSSVGVADSTLTAEGSLQVDQNLTVTGNLIINGTSATINTTNLNVEDPLISLAKANNTSDTLDIGFFGLYDTTGNQDLYAGLFRDASDGKFKLFKDLQDVPTTTVDISGAGYESAALVVGALEASSLSLTTDLAVAQGGTGASSLTDHGVLLGSGTDPITALTVGTNGQLLVGSTGADPVFADLSAGDGLTATTGAGSLGLAVDLKAESGLVIDGGEIAVKLDASSITGTLAVGDGGTGQTSLDDIVNASNGGITVAGGEDTVIGGDVSLALNLSNLAAASVDVSADSIAIIDANDSNTSKQELIKDVITAVAGNKVSTGLSATNGVLSVDLSGITDVQVASGDKFLMLDSDGSTEQLESVDDIAGFMAGNGLSASSGVLSVDLNELTEAVVNVATDSIIFTDSDDSNSTKRETIGDLIASIAGAGLTSTDGVLAVSQGTGLEIDSDTIRISSAAAGDGLSGGSGSALAVDLNELTAAVVDVSNDSIAIIDANDSNGTKKESIGDLISSIAGDGLAANAGVLSVTVDDSTLEINSDTVRVKDDGITLAKLSHFTEATMVVVGAQASSTTPVEITVLDEDDMASDSATSLVTQQSVKAFVSSQATRFGGIFASSAKINANKDSNDVYDVEMDSNPIIRGKIGPFAYDLGSFNNSFPFSSDIIFYGETVTSASDRHFKVNINGDLEFEGAAFATP